MAAIYTEVFRENSSSGQIDRCPYTEPYTQSLTRRGLTRSASRGSRRMIIAAATDPELGFPAWLRITHFLNFLFLGLLIRSGWEIIATHPRFYWRNDCGPGGL